MRAETPRQLGDRMTLSGARWITAAAAPPIGASTKRPGARAPVVKLVVDRWRGRVDFHSGWRSRGRRQVVFKHRFGLRRRSVGSSITASSSKLIATPERVEVGRTDPDPSSVSDGGLGVHRLPRRFPNPNAVHRESTDRIAGSGVESTGGRIDYWAPGTDMTRWRGAGGRR